MADGHIIFGGKASEPDTSRPVEKRNFYLPDLHLVIPSEFRRYLWRQKTRVLELSYGVVCVILRLAVWYNPDL